MTRFPKNEKGFTLVELLIVLAIGSMILIITTNLHVFTQNQYRSQKEKANNLFVVTHVAKVITQEVRTADNIKIINKHQIRFDETDYNWDNNTIYKNFTPFIEGIDYFEVDIENGKLLLFIQSSNKTIETELTLR